MTNLKDQGMVFVIRPVPDAKPRYLWLYPEMVLQGDVDCSFMNDEQFEEVVVFFSAIETAHNIKT